MRGSAAQLHAATLARARREAGLRVLLLVLPWAALALWLALRHAELGWPWLALVAGIAVGCTWLVSAWRSRDLPWLARLLNEHPLFEDSAGLLLGLDTPGSALARLQHSRLQSRWQALDTEALYPRPAKAPLGWNLLAALACAGALWTWQQPLPEAVRTQLPAPLARALGVQSPALAAVRIHVRPPAYTGLPTQTHARADLRIPQSADLRWALRFSVAPTRAWLQFEQGPRVALDLVDGTWQAARRIEQASLYRIVTEPALPPAQRTLHRIAVIRDQPPQVRATTPARSLSLRAPGQSRWPLVFSASDDHAIAPRAELRIIQTSGDGENIASTERSVILQGRGTTRAKTYSHVFDLARSGLTVGNDVIVQLTVRDTRQPQSHVVRSASVILRWPPEAVRLAEGMDGLVQRVLPAYFRSQRQIIIDAEKLLRERPRLADEAFVQRSDAIGVDQHALRLRYGQFLGEEGAEPARLPTNDVEENGDDLADQAREETAPEHDDAHDAGHAPGESDADALLAQISHVHDVPEAATLLDPQTRDTLRAALREMWQSEMHLRQGEPAQALPFANRALGYIKQVQQADRIYLPRIGSEQAPIDFDRRLGGKRDGLASRGAAWVARPLEATPLHALWQSLARDRDGMPVPAASLEAASRWLTARNDASGNTLAARAAMDAVRQQPACGSCRQALRAALWPMLAPAVPRPLPRPAPTAQGNAYLDALQRERGR